jgi:hypothetical protein
VACVDRIAADEVLDVDATVAQLFQLCELRRLNRHVFVVAAGTALTQILLATSTAAVALAATSNP